MRPVPSILIAAFLAAALDAESAQQKRSRTVTPQERIARTLFFEDAQHPSTPADTLWNRAQKRVTSPVFRTDTFARVKAICDEINRPKAFSAWNSGKLWTLPIPTDKASQRAWARCMAIANDMVMGCHVTQSAVDHYHTASVNPAWNRGMAFIGRVGDHLLWRAKA